MVVQEQLLPQLVKTTQPFKFLRLLPIQIVMHKMEQLQQLQVVEQVVIPILGIQDKLVQLSVIYLLEFIRLPLQMLTAVRELDQYKLDKTILMLR